MDSKEPRESISRPLRSIQSVLSLKGMRLSTILSIPPLIFPLLHPAQQSHIPTSYTYQSLRMASEEASRLFSRASSPSPSQSQSAGYTDLLALRSLFSYPNFLAEQSLPMAIPPFFRETMNCRIGVRVSQLAIADSIDCSATIIPRAA